MARKKDLYRILGVNHKADPSKIKKAYRRAAKKYHPDVSPKGEEKFKEVQEAYETLSNPQKKAAYDRGTSLKSVPRHHAYHSSQNLTISPSSLFDEIDEFFSSLEGFWMHGPADFFDEWDEDRADFLSLEIILSPSEARDGCEVPLRFPFWSDCKECQGIGLNEGIICRRCRGHGKEKLQKKIRIAIPRGVRDGTLIRIPLREPNSRGVDLIATLRVSGSSTS